MKIEQVSKKYTITHRFDATFKVTDLEKNTTFGRFDYLDSLNILYIERYHFNLYFNNVFLNSIG